jgi:hypothetical protein
MKTLTIFFLFASILLGQSAKPGRLTWSDVPAAVTVENPHPVATSAYWQWITDRSEKFSRMVVVVSSYPNGSILGWVTNEGTLGAFRVWLEKPNAYWFYLDAILTGSTGDSVRLEAEVSRLKIENEFLAERIRNAKAELSLAPSHSKP